MTIWSDCWTGTGGIASAEDAKAKAKATAISLIISHSSLDDPSRISPSLRPLVVVVHRKGGKPTLMAH
jgi:hypothetical protein